MRVGGGNLGTKKNQPLCPPQIPHDLTWAQSWQLNCLSYSRVNSGPNCNRVILVQIESSYPIFLFEVPLKIFRAQYFDLLL
jgi:hypothetical protein